MARRLSHAGLGGAGFTLSIGAKLAQLPPRAALRSRQISAGSALSGSDFPAAFPRLPPRARVSALKGMPPLHGRLPSLIDRRPEVALRQRGLRLQRLAPAGARFFRLAAGFQQAAPVEQRLDRKST